MEVKPDSSNSVSLSADDTSQKQEAFTHLAQGKRHLLVRDYYEAVTSLAQACKLLAEQYGECANECGDAYFSYGKALLELARTESGVLGDAIEGDHDESNDDDDDDDDDETEEQGEENEDGKLENGKVEEKDNGKDEKLETEVDKGDTKEGDGETKTENDENKPENEDDDSNLKLAWEMLELAKLIFERQAEGNQKISLMLAEVYLKLGEVSLESENYVQATEDIQSCLKIQIANLPEDDRFIAETYYQLGIAYSMGSDFDKAIDQFKNAADLIEKRIKNLEAKKDAGGDCVEETKSDPFYTLDGEIKELKDLLPEVKDKVTDMEDFKFETIKALTTRVGQQFSGKADGSSGSSSSSAPTQTPAPAEAKPVSNISHLVRKKRKPDETLENKGTESAIVPSKQAKTE